jgi:hypothetical protein
MIFHKGCGMGVTYGEYPSWVVNGLSGNLLQFNKIEIGRK